MRPSDVVCRWIDAINKHDLDEVAACFGEDYVDEAPARVGEFVHGRRHVRHNFTRLSLSPLPPLRRQAARTAANR